METGMDCEVGSGRCGGEGGAWAAVAAGGAGATAAGRKGEKEKGEAALFDCSCCDELRSIGCEDAETELAADDAAADSAVDPFDA